MKRSAKFAAVAVAISTLGALTLAAPAAVAGTPRVGRITSHRVIDWQPSRTGAQSASVAKASAKAGIPLFTNTVKDGTSNFSYTMVGKDPSIATAKPSVTIKTVVVPLKIHFTNGDTWDPSAADSCDSATALNRTLNSPVFVAQKWKAASAKLGTAQYDDAFQREEFYKFSQPSGINPGYHVKLAPTTMATVTVNVPVGSSAEGTAACGNGKFAGIEIGWFDSFLQNTLIPSIPNATTVFPLFLMENTILYQGTTANCCILGYHNAYTPGGKFQSYGVSEYDNTSAFTGVADVSALTHEVGEWMNDPNVVNPTKPWGHIGQVSGCQGNLEVGDPLSGTTITDTINGKTYHLQELAFFSWFYHQKPSLGANGWYSSGGTFTKPAAKCK